MGAIPLYDLMRGRQRFDARLSHRTESGAGLTLHEPVSADIVSLLLQLTSAHYGTTLHVGTLPTYPSYCTVHMVVIPGHPCIQTFTARYNNYPRVPPFSSFLAHVLTVSR